ncbi:MULTISPECIES: porin [Pseudoxanthomonas]|jgi:predicted porin|uniref:Porin n=1 Tax=Pseudoxanthomonas winnipegensis TaxID=2480810 RepID=A0A4Q8LTR7_9GAMM|nr:porin [Pseudoxanthomonas winnipegensis]RZZ88457.1 porin [Pseudoxanthomonas winnipegensis]TAA06948.1 porin [Pseudoxanthomonas winnipegensis]TAA16861.1 porin [Pseudoxanthomonas winnipegensis]TAA34744.1 porin [Pseudoxanthomonas winnipegensis]TAA43408.1 porin [Pseudoxanthomonas winnipegensis]
MYSRTACALTTLLAGLSAAPLAHAQQEDASALKWSDGKASVTFYGTLDIGYVGRGGGNGLVPDNGTEHDIQSAAGSDGSRVGLKLAYALNDSVTLIGESELGINYTGQHDYGSGGDTYWNRHTWLGATGKWGTLLAGKIDGGRASVLKAFDPFQGRSVAAGGALQVVTSRAEEAVAYVTPSWKGLNATLAYTPNLNGVSDHDARSPVYAVILAYKQGPLSLTWDHEEEWWNRVPGLTRLKVNVAAASYDFGPLKLWAYRDRTTVESPVSPALGFYDDHTGYLFGVTVPMGEKGLWKASWNRRDSAAVDNVCSKWGIGYQHTLDKRTYLYADYAHIRNDRNGTCTIAYSNEATSADQGAGDAGGYGVNGVDFGLVFSF